MRKILVTNTTSLDWLMHTCCFSLKCWYICSTLTHIKHIYFNRFHEMYLFSAHNIFGAFSIFFFSTLEMRLFFGHWNDFDIFFFKFHYGSSLSQLCFFPFSQLYFFPYLNYTSSPFSTVLLPIRSKSTAILAILYSILGIS